MGLLSKKPKVAVEELLQVFYDSQIFHKTAEGNDVSSRLTREVINFVAEADPAFKTIDVRKLKLELMALRIELFNLAWVTYNYELSKTNQNVEDKDFIKGMILTKSYLVKLEREDIWDIMGEYNSVIVKAEDDISAVSWSGINTSPFPGFPNVAVQFSNQQSKGEFLLDTREIMRQSIRQRCSQAFTNSAEDCADRYANLLTGCNSWNEGVISQKLTLELTNRLGFDLTLSCEAMFRLQRVIVGLYNGARDFVEIKPFTREYIESYRNVIIGMKKAVENLKSNRTTSP